MPRTPTGASGTAYMSPAGPIAQLTDGQDEMNAGLRTAGAGPTLEHAAAPAVIAVSDETRVLVFACAMESSGVPASWAATEPLQPRQLNDPALADAIDPIAPTLRESQ